MHLSRLLATISILAIIFMACSGSTTLLTSPLPTDTSAPVAQPEPTTVTQAQGLALPHGWTLVMYTAAIPYSYEYDPAFAKLGQLKVSASCQPGERMVGAGYAATSVFETNATIVASYPVNDHTWVAIGGTQAGIRLDVYCLHGANLPSVTIASGVADAADCPAGAVLLAEGFGRAAEGATTWPTYALCSTSGVEAGARATAPVAFDPIHNGYMAGHASVSCPAGQIAFGGGSTGVFTFASGATANFTSWDITGGEGSGAVYADCVRLV